MSIAWCGICDNLNTKFQASTYSSNYLRAPYHNFFPKVAKTFSLSYFSHHIHRREQLSSQSSHVISCFWDTFFHAKETEIEYSSLVLVLQRSASELWNHRFLTRWYISQQCIVDTSTFHILWEQTMGVNFWNYLVFGNDFFRWNKGRWKSSEFLCIFGILWYVHLCPIVFYWWKFHKLFCWTDAGSLSPSYQPKVGFLFFSVVEKPFFSLLFLRLFITDIAVFIFIIMQKVEVKFTKKNAEKPDTFLPGEQSLSDADCLYMFHYNGELAWVIYGDIINSVGIIRISFSRWI